jgi:para-nitrobenzyl esterase
VPGLALPGDPEEQSEDCLTANVWTPDPPDRGPGPGRPVMVFIHGGGFTTGNGGSLLYRGSGLARTGGVVVVTGNYRLGALGWMAHPALDEPGRPAGNWGLQDQLALLAWVRDNIAAFGGDPGKVTVFGESAGAMSVCALLAAPGAGGLFHRAAVQSGPGYCHTRERGARAAEDLVAVLGLARADRAVLERVPAPDLVAATAELGRRPPGPGELPLPFLPVVDGTLLPQAPLAAAAAGNTAPVPLLIGTNRDELTLFALGDPALAAVDDQGLARWLARSAPGLDTGPAVARYTKVREARDEPVGPRDLWVAMGSDLVFRWPSLQFAAAHARHHPATFAYLFTQTTPAFGGLLGSPHGLEIPFVFGGLHRELVGTFAGDSPEARALSARMQAHWLAFARSGDPGLDDDPWPAFDAVRRRTMVFGPDGGAAEAPRDEELSVWAELAPLQGPPLT